MLKFFSRLEKTRNFVLFLFAAVMVAGLVFVSFPTSDNTRTNRTASSDTVAKVGDEKVTANELSVQKESLAQLYGTRLPASGFLLDAMIRDRIVRQEAEKLGLTATDQEVAAEIRRQFDTGDGKPLDQRRYEQIAIERYGSVKAYEQSVRDDLSGQKLQAFVTSGVSVSEEEILNDFRRRNTKFDLTYVPVGVAEVAKAVNPSEEQLKNYFEQNKANYRLTLPQKKIRYIFVNTAKIGEKLNIPEADIQAEYDKLPVERRQAGVEGQQIVLKVPSQQEDAQVLTRATELVERARKEGGKISEEAFAELARGFSQDPATAQNGGKLRGLVRPNPNNPTDPYQQILQMQPGEVTDPINYGGNYYILRRGNPVAKSFEDARKEIEISLRNRRSYAAAAEIAQKITARLKETKDVQKVAEEFAAQANMTPAEMIRETGFVKPGDEVENVGVSPQFEEGIAALATPGDVGERIPIKDGFAIPLLIEKRDPRDAEFAEVRDRVAEDFRQVEARNRVEQIAREIAGGAANAANLAQAAQSKGLTAKEAKSFILGSPLGEDASAVTSEALEEAVYSLKTGEVTKNPIKVGDNWYVVGVTNRAEPDMNEFAAQRDQIAQGILGARRGQVFSDYLADVRRRMEAAGEIKIYRDVLERLDAAETTNQ